MSRKKVTDFKYSVLLTKKGYDQKKSRLEKCLNLLHNELPVRFKQAKEHDSEILENREFIDFETQRELLEAEVDYLQDLLLRAKVIDLNLVDTEHANIGTRVVLESVLKPKKQVVVELVSPAEVDLEHRRISTLSPLGQQLLGKKKGHTVSVKTSKSKTTYKIIDIDVAR